MFKPLQVIRHIGPCTDTGIVISVNGRWTRIMFETANCGVEIKEYTIGGLKDYRVIG